MRNILMHSFCCFRKITMFPFPLLWYFDAISSKSMQVSPSIYNICRIFHLSPTSFDTRCIRILKSVFQKKVKFARETKGGKCSGSFAIFPRNGPSGWRSHFLYCSLSSLTPVIRLSSLVTDWRCDAARETSLPLPSNWTRSGSKRKGCIEASPPPPS